MRSHDLEDLIGAGMIGLLHARHRFDPSRGVKFATFARRRIVGAAIDYQRELLGRHTPKIRPTLEVDMQPAPDDEGDSIMAANVGVSGDSGTERQVSIVRERVRLRLLETMRPRTAVAAVLHVFDRRMLREVGDDLGVSEARACQLLTPAIRARARTIIEEEIAAVAAGRTT